MRKIFSLFCVIFYVFMVNAQKKEVSYPAFEFSKSGLYTISKISTNDTSTLVKLDVMFIPGWWTKYAKDNFLRDVKTGQKYFAKDIIGAVFDKELRTPKSGDTVVTLIFDRLPPTVKKVDFGKEDAVYVFGVDLNKSSAKIKKASADIPASASSWLHDQLKSARVKTEINDFSIEFFRKDTSRVVGYIKGYDLRSGFTSGMVYASNYLTREDYPKTIQVYPDGRFEVDFELNHPIESYLSINNAIVKFYIEPGQTLGVILDWRDFLQEDRYRDRSYKWQFTEFLGPLKDINNTLARLEVKRGDYRELEKDQKAMLPNDFKEKGLRLWREERLRLDALLSKDQYTEKVKSLAKSNVDVAYATYLFDFNLSRDYYSKQDTANKIVATPVADEYYDFIKLVDLNSLPLFVSSDFSTFINRFEFSKLFRKDHPYSVYDGFSYQDSIAKAQFGKIPLVFDVAKLRSLNSQLKFQADTSQLAALVSNAMLTVDNSFFKSEANRLKVEKIKRSVAYELPNTMQADIFRKIIDHHKGKVLIIDFWAEWCGPCRAGIESSLSDREKYVNNADFDFVFITDEKGTAKPFYDKYTETNAMRNSYRISADDYMALRELFKFNGIPRYVLVTADGKISDDNFSMHNWKNELTIRFPNQFSRAYFQK